MFGDTHLLQNTFLCLIVSIKRKLLSCTEHYKELKLYTFCYCIFCLKVGLLETSVLLSHLLFAAITAKFSFQRLDRNQHHGYNSSHLVQCCFCLFEFMIYSTGGHLLGVESLKCVNANMHPQKPICIFTFVVKMNSL